jgi:DNA polymerase-1
MNKILLIDGNNTAWRAYHKYKGLKHKKTHVSMIFGMPSIVNGLIKKFKPEHVIIVWDGGKSEHRMSAHPDYKKRKPNPDFEDFSKQKDFTMDLFYLMGIPQVKNPKMEADDYIYMLSRKFKKTHRVIIASGDKDFKTIVSKRVNLWDVGKNNLIGSKNIQKIEGYTVRQMLDFLILNGDKSDNIPGYRGMGEVRCKEFLTKFNSIQQFLDSKEEYRFIDRNTLLEVYKKNTLLIDLKYFYETFLKGKIKITYYKGERQPKFQKEAFLKVCRKLQIKTFQQKAFLKNYE